MNSALHSKPRRSTLAPLPLCSAISQHRRVLRRFFNAEDAKVGAEERGGEFSLRPSREPLRPLRLIRLSGILVVASPRYAFALNRNGMTLANFF
jgi:hypothetical protein